MSEDDPSVLRRLEEEVLAYRQIIVSEVRTHRRFSRISVLTAFSLIGLGVAASFYYPALGWLLLIFGAIRVLNSVYHLQRGERLQQILRQLDERFGRES